jgi:hypothetical protein
MDQGRKETGFVHDKVYGSSLRQKKKRKSELFAPTEAGSMG